MSRGPIRFTMFWIAVSYESSNAARLFRMQLAGVCNLEVAKKCARQHYANAKLTMA
jgi:hypothetical protein